MRANRLVMVIGVALIVACLFLAGCSEKTPVRGVSTDPEPPAESTSTEIPHGGDTVDVLVYFSRDEVIAASTRAVPRTTAMARVALEQLLQGANTAESDIGMTSAIPAGTRLLGVTVSGGLATVNLSREFTSGGGSLSMQLRAAQVVYTLTQFPTVETVAFEVEDKPVQTLGGEGLEVGPSVGRADFENVTPAILVESPTPGARVSSPLRLTGTANVFEAMFVVTVTAPGGEIVTEQAVQTTSGTGTRGTFDEPVEFDIASDGAGTVIVYEPSPKDGAPTNMVRLPVTLVTAP
ncbi:MAG: Gmad2 immunoglobulin-like domain-containing protein [Actinomycetota bacterium]|nr:Gmad2 immunoglobulin-like domain-containing protein [Actinomycetota bacterium]